MKVPDDSTLHEDFVRKLAFAFLPGAKASLLNRMEECGISVDDFFNLGMTELHGALGVTKRTTFADSVRDEALVKARKEIRNLQDHDIEMLFILDGDYPTRLAQAPDAPAVLFKYGDADLNPRHVVNLVGTRHATQYGLKCCRTLIEDFAALLPDLTVVSGLAFGIDTAAHAAALEFNLPTVACLGHGLHKIYPEANRDLARDIVRHGGALLSEYPYGSHSHQHYFLERNRIIAGLSDVTIVVESDFKGGALSTARMALSYGRELMAVPGRTTDQYSTGCNNLIRRDCARMITDASDLLEVTGWSPLDMGVTMKQPNLFPELDGDCRLIHDTLLNQSEPMQVDRIHALTCIPVAQLTSLLTEMEFDGILIRHPGNRYSL